MRPPQMHLTLHFLGDMPLSEAEDGARTVLHDALARVRHEPFTIALRGTGVFPPRGRPTVLWAGVAETAPLITLHAALGAALQACGLPVERRPYLPHVTLARLTPAAPRAWTHRFLADTTDLAIDGITVDHFQLYRSTRLDGVTEHAVEATVSLGTGA